MVTAVQRGLPWPLLKPTGTYVWPRSSPLLRLRGLQRPCVSGPSAHQGHPGCEALLCRTLRCVRCQRKLGMGPPPQCRPRPGGRAPQRSGGALPRGDASMALSCRLHQPAPPLRSLTRIRPGHLSHNSVHPAPPALLTRSIPQAQAGSPPTRSSRRGRELRPLILLHHRRARDGTSDHKGNRGEPATRWRNRLWPPLRYAHFPGVHADSCTAHLSRLRRMA